MRSINRLLPFAALVLLAACGGKEPSPTAPANTTEVSAATENVTTSDAMVTNIDAAAPTGGDVQEPSEAEDMEPASGNSAENSL